MDSVYGDGTDAYSDTERTEAGSRLSKTPMHADRASTKLLGAESV